MHEFRFVLGDSGGAGHRVCDTCTIQCNYSPEELAEFYYSAVELTGINFIRTMDWYDMDESLFNILTDKFGDIGIELDEDLDRTDYINIFWYFVRLVKDDIIMVQKYLPSINQFLEKEDKNIAYRITWGY